MVYEHPEMEVILLEDNDVITLSNAKAGDGQKASAKEGFF